MDESEWPDMRDVQVKAAKEADESDGSMKKAFREGFRAKYNGGKLTAQMILK